MNLTTHTTVAIALLSVFDVTTNKDANSSVGVQKPILVKYASNGGMTLHFSDEIICGKG